MDNLQHLLPNLSFDGVQEEYRVIPPPLSDQDKTRVCLIEDLNKIQVALTKKAISPEQFERFMETPVQQLEVFVTDQSMVLCRIIEARKIYGADF